MISMEMDRKVTSVKRIPLVTRVPFFELSGGEQPQVTAVSASEPSIQQLTNEKNAKCGNQIATYYLLNECKLILFGKHV